MKMAFFKDILDYFRRHPGRLLHLSRDLQDGVQEPDPARLPCSLAPPGTR